MLHIAVTGTHTGTGIERMDGTLRRRRIRGDASEYVSHETVRHFTPAQGQYDRAREAYLNEEYIEAKRLLMELLESIQDEKVLRWNHTL
jgi:hypothetical protein